MKKTTLFKMTLLLCFLLAGGLSAWSAESDNVLIKTVDFSSAEWSTLKSYGSFSPSDGTVQGCTANAELLFATDGSMNFSSSNLGTTNGTNALLIPLENINGSIRVVVTSTNSSSKVYWSIKEGESGTITTRTATTAGSTQTFNYTMTTSESTATLYIGRQGSKVAPQVAKIEVYTAEASSVATPTITFSSPQVTLFTPTAGAVIYYTLDGTAPDNTSTLYSGPFNIDDDKVVKAIAYKGVAFSEISSKYCGFDKTFNTTTLIRFDDGNFTSPAGNVIEGITFGSDMKGDISSSYSIDGLTFTKAIQFGGSDARDTRFYSFKVAGACRVYIYGHSNNSDVRHLSIATGDKPEISEFGYVEGGSICGFNCNGYTDVTMYEYMGSGSTTIWIMNGIGCNYNINAIKIVFGTENEYTVSIGETGMATLALPFPVTIPDGITAYIGKTNTAKTCVNLKKINDGVIPANQAVAIEGTPLTNYTFHESVSAGTAVSELSGTYKEGKDISTDGVNYYVLTNQGGEAVFAKIVDNSAYKVIPAHKMYLNMGSSSAPELLSLNIDNEDVETTNIETTESNLPEMDDVKTFNLAGQQVTKKSKGLYIINGKKVVKQ